MLDLPHVHATPWTNAMGRRGPPGRAPRRPGRHGRLQVPPAPYACHALDLVFAGIRARCSHAVLAGLSAERGSYLMAAPPEASYAAVTGNRECQHARCPTYAKRVKPFMQLLEIASNNMRAAPHTQKQRICTMHHLPSVWLEQRRRPGERPARRGLPRRRRHLVQLGRAKP